MRVSSVVQHATPSVYACYCLRSLSRHNLTYIGSTPDPVRRFKQHNGLIKQGAFKTRLARPWSMDVVVYGFPSRIAALQFEWTWQNPHVSRHLRVVDPVIAAESLRSREDEYTGRSTEPLFPTTRRSGRSNKLRSTAVPEHKMAVLRALLVSEPFCHWDLHVAFYSAYAYGVWHYFHKAHPTRYDHTRVTQRPLARSYPSIQCDFRGVLHQNEPLIRGEHGPRFPVLPEASTQSAAQKRSRARNKDSEPEYSWPEPMPPARDAETLGLTWELLEAAPQPAAPSGIPAMLDEKARARAAQARKTRTSGLCGVCGEAIDCSAPLTYTHCPHTCGAVYHLTCLARHSLAREARLMPSPRRRFCVPLTAACPNCECEPVPWPQVVRQTFRYAEQETC